MLSLQSRAGRQHPNPALATRNCCRRWHCSLSKQLARQPSPAQPEERAKTMQGKKAADLHTRGQTHVQESSYNLALPQTPASAAFRRQFSCRDVPVEKLGGSFQAQSPFLCHHLSSTCSLSPCDHQLTSLTVMSQLVGGRAPDSQPTIPSPSPEVT